MLSSKRLFLLFIHLIDSFPMSKFSKAVDVVVVVGTVDVVVCCVVGTVDVVVVGTVDVVVGTVVAIHLVVVDYSGVTITAVRAGVVVKWSACSPSFRRSEFESRCSLQLLFVRLIKKNENLQKEAPMAHY